MERKCKCGAVRGVRAKRDGTGYSCYYCDNARRAEDELRLREQERDDQIRRDLAEGRRDGYSGRITPRFED